MSLRQIDEMICLAEKLEPMLDRFKGQLFAALGRTSHDIAPVINHGLASEGGRRIANIQMP